MRRWVVREGDGATALEILQRLGEGESAIVEGRVFVGRRRARQGTDGVKPGDVVTVGAPPDLANSQPIEILLRTGDLLAVAKPAGMSTIPDHGGASESLASRAASAADLEPAQLHATSRLDRDVSGVVVFALTPGAAIRLQAARESKLYKRRYFAIAAAAPTPSVGAWDEPIGKAADPRHRTVRGRDATDAVTKYAAVDAARSGQTLLAVTPISGRTHQIRVHAAHAGAPLLGDALYGGPSRLTLANGRVLAFVRIMLHAARVTVPLNDGEIVTIDAPLPPELQALWASLEGGPAAWENALSCDLA